MSGHVRAIAVGAPDPELPNSPVIEDTITNIHYWRRRCLRPHFVISMA